ncbi:MAG: GGDEF domain-containing protein [Rhodoferax sp.]|nr:MAG: GGDEF domain-containing protein [Rhodoferax sp.]
MVGFPLPCAPMPLKISQLLFGNVQFDQSEELDEFRYKFLIVLMVTGALFTGLLVWGDTSAVNPIGMPHLGSMTVFTTVALLLWLLLRGHPARLQWVAWSYEILGLLEYTSALVYVPRDELRLLWFFVNVPGVFILLGQRAGWVITGGTMLGLALGNQWLSRPYSANAMATGLLAMLYLGVFFHAYVDRSISYFTRMQLYNRRLEDLASHDNLTGLLNGRAYYAQCDQQVRACERSGQPYAVLFVDLDHFKAVNDTHGHEAGDAVLKMAAHTLQGHIRQSDLLGRIGGEEFSVFLPHTDHAGALALAETLRRAVEAARVQVGAQLLQVTASIGVASNQARAVPMAELQKNADEAMYQAKKAGRNRVSSLAVS